VGYKLTTLVVIGTDCIGSCKSIGSHSRRPLKLQYNPILITIYHHFFPCQFFQILVTIKMEKYKILSCKYQKVFHLNKMDKTDNYFLLLAVSSLKDIDGISCFIYLDLSRIYVSNNYVFLQLN